MRCSKNQFFVLFFILLVLFIEFGLLIVTTVALMPASRAIACCPRPTRAPTAWAFIQLLSYRKSTRCSTKAAAGTVIRRADEVEREVAVGAVARPITPVLRRGRAIELLFTGNTQRIVASVGGEVAVLRNIAAVRAALHHWLVVSQIITFIADVAAVLVIDLTTTLVLIRRRIVGLAEIREVRLKAGVAAAAEDACLL
jgi:hypothetical protein